LYGRGFQFGSFSPWTVSPDAAACDQRSGTSLRFSMRLSVRTPLMWSTISSLVSFLPR
jgi:hypothetical protein